MGNVLAKRFLRVLVFGILAMVGVILASPAQYVPTEVVWAVPVIVALLSMLDKWLREWIAQSQGFVGLGR